jgi:hypothetical protein
MDSQMALKLSLVSPQGAVRDAKVRISVLGRRCLPRARRHVAVLPQKVDDDFLRNLLCRHARVRVHGESDHWLIAAVDEHIANAPESVSEVQYDPVSITLVNGPAKLFAQALDPLPLGLVRYQALHYRSYAVRCFEITLGELSHHLPKASHRSPPFEECRAGLTPPCWKDFLLVTSENG